MEEKELFQWDEVSLYVVLRDLLVNLWVVVMAGVAVWIGIGNVAKLTYVPQYTSYATMVVTAKGENINIYSNLAMASQMAQVIGEVFSSNVLSEAVASDLEVDDVSGAIQASVISKTNVLTVQATAPTARLAHQILLSALNNYSGVSDYLFSNADLRVLQQPSVPMAPSNSTDVTHIQKIGAVGAMILVAVCSVLSTVFRPTVQTDVGVTRNIDVGLLGTIPFERKWKSLRDLLKREKRSLILDKPGVSMSFSESCRKIATRLELRMRRNHGKILLVTSVGENEGKSSVSVNIALALANKGRKVLLLDGDLKKPALHKILQLQNFKSKTLQDYLNGEVSAEGMIQYLETEGLYVASFGPNHTQEGDARETSVLRQLIGTYAQIMDYVIVDSAPMAVTSDTEFLLEAVDSVLFVVRQDWCGIDAINEKLQTITQHHVGIEGIVLNAAHPLSLNFERRDRYEGYISSNHHHHVEVENER